MSDFPFAAIMAGIKADGPALTAPLPENWMQGRTTYGGLTAALLLEAARRGHADLPPLRSAMINFTRIIHDGAVFCWQRWRKCLIQRIERVYNQSRTPDNDCQRRHE